MVVINLLGANKCMIRKIRKHAMCNYNKVYYRRSQQAKIIVLNKFVDL